VSKGKKTLDIDSLKAKTLANIEKVKSVLDIAIAEEPKARKAAQILDAMLNLHSERKLDAREYLTGDSVADAAMLRAIAIDVADNDPFTLEQVLDFLYSIVEGATKLTSVVMLFV